jgi:hypothetical protein
MARRKTLKTFVPITSKNSASGDGTTVAGGCVYFSFHCKCANLESKFV